MVKVKKKGLRNARYAFLIQAQGSAQEERRKNMPRLTWNSFAAYFVNFKEKFLLQGTLGFNYLFSFNNALNHLYSQRLLKIILWALARNHIHDMWAYRVNECSSWVVLLLDGWCHKTSYAAIRMGMLPLTFTQTFVWVYFSKHDILLFEKYVVYRCVCKRRFHNLCA